MELIAIGEFFASLGKISEEKIAFKNCKMSGGQKRRADDLMYLKSIPCILFKFLAWDS